MTNQKRPSVVVFFTDQQRWDSTGVHGNPMGLTPNFDRMAQDGTHCYNAFTPQPVCLPARICLQTGRYASNYDTHSNAGELPVGSVTLGHRFREAGYYTGYIGKWHMCHENPVPKNRRDGYDYWLGSNVLEFTSDAYNVTMYNNDGEPVQLPGYRVDAVADAAIRFIDSNKDNPFFLFTSFLEPHYQNHRDDYPAPTGYEEKYMDCWMPPDLRTLGGSSARHLPGYYGMIKRLDEAFGRVLDALKSLGLEKNTIVVFATDHGCHFKTRNKEYKRSCHDASMRIPLALKGPGFTSGGRIQEMISLIDLPCTLLDACALPVPADMQGHSFLPLIRHSAKDWQEEVYSEMFETYLSRCVRTKRWKYSIRKKEKGIEDLSSWEFVEDFLYDLKADQYELDNLAGLDSHRKVADRMKKRLIRRMIAAGEPEPVIKNAPIHHKGQRSVTEEEIYE